MRQDHTNIHQVSAQMRCPEGFIAMLWAALAPELQAMAVWTLYHNAPCVQNDTSRSQRWCHLLHLSEGRGNWIEQDNHLASRRTDTVVKLF
jgi:hypothetical protein